MQAGAVGNERVQPVGREPGAHHVVAPLDAAGTHGGVGRGKVGRHLVVAPRSRASRRFTVAAASTLCSSAVSTTPYCSRAWAAETYPSRTSRNTRCGSRSSGSPQPPPPAVMYNTSVPAGQVSGECVGTWKSLSPGVFTSVDATWPLPPPSKPHGGHVSRPPSPLCTFTR